MPKNRKQTSDISDEVYDLLRHVPWWGGPPLILFVWVFFRYLIPAILGILISGLDESISAGLSRIVTSTSDILAWLLAVAVAAIWVRSLINKYADAHRLDRQSGIDSIRGLHWQEFELLLAEAFRRQGYGVRETGPGADGGIDLILSKGGRDTIVQAKQWRKKSVGVKVVRELNGVRSADDDEGAIVVASGRFTREAVQFANDRGVELIDGGTLVPMIAEVQRSGRMANQKPADPSAEAVTPLTPSCPACGSSMVRRVAKRGSNAGQAFWGCPTYPTCRGTRPID